MVYDPEKHHRRSHRLRGYDYTSPGAYFVTICVDSRECVLGSIDETGEMHHSSLGRIARKSWQWLATQYNYLMLDCFVVMPNHVHGILIITDDEPNQGDSVKGGSRTAPTRRKPLGRLVGAFKTVSTKSINQELDTPGEKFWQRDFYDHIIRNDKELSSIRGYVYYNPKQWAADRDNPVNW